MADGEKRVIDLQALSTNDLTANHYFLVDDASNDGETKKYSASDYKVNMQITAAVLYNEVDVSDAAWDSNTQYHKHDLVIYMDYMLYMCKVDDSTRGTWVSNEWQRITLLELWGDSMMTISTEPMLFDGTPYSKNDIVYRISPNSTAPYKMSFYKAKADLPNGISSYVATDWNEFSTITDLIEDCNRQIDKLEDDMSQALAEGTASGSIANFTDGSTLPMKNLEVDIEPVQDLHGYDNPWVGGSGKNKLPTYEGNAVTDKGVTFTPQADGSVICNGTATATVTFSGTMGTFEWDGISDYWLSGCPNGGGTNSFSLRVDNENAIYSKSDVGQGIKLQSEYGDITNKTLYYNIVIRSGYACNNLRFKPMLNSGLSAQPYEPYSNICPISGWDEVNVGVCGINYFDKTTIQNGYVNDATGVVSTGAGAKCTDFIRVLPNTSYYIKSEQTSGMWGAYYDENKNYVSGVTSYSNRVITTPSNAKYVRLTVLYNNSGNIDTFGINYPSTDTSYHAYNGQTYTIDLDGTRYGGTLDVVSGVLTVDRDYKDLGDLTWTYESGNKQFYSNVISDAPSASGWTFTNIINSNYKIDYRAYEVIAEPHMRGFNGQRLYIVDDRYTDVTQFKTYLSGAIVVYKLDTPQTYQLTPTEVKTLLGQNNIFADTGQVNDATYVRNANITINDLIRRIEALES